MPNGYSATASEAGEMLSDMLTDVDLNCLRGATIVDAQTRNFHQGQALRLTLASGAVLIVSADGPDVSVADGQSIP